MGERHRPLLIKNKWNLRRLHHLLHHRMRSPATEEKGTMCTFHLLSTPAHVFSTCPTIGKHRRLLFALNAKSIVKN
eukprot:m.7354 g.7354  ORF g.7354 m.7354 type:complete len:76 (-) comp5183_c0_seq1:93-320(-)